MPNIALYVNLVLSLYKCRETEDHLQFFFFFHLPYWIFEEKNCYISYNNIFDFKSLS